MTKATMNTILTLIANIETPEADEVREALNAELNKGAEKRDANAKAYSELKPIVFAGLRQATSPVTISELFETIKGELPEGVTKAKVQYGVTRLWSDEIVKTEGKVNSYSLKG